MNFDPGTVRNLSELLHDDAEPISGHDKHALLLALKMLDDILARYAREINTAWKERDMLRVRCRSLEERLAMWEGDKK